MFREVRLVLGLLPIWQKTPPTAATFHSKQNGERYGTNVQDHVVDEVNVTQNGITHRIRPNVTSDVGVILSRLISESASSAKDQS